MYYCKIADGVVVNIAVFDAPIPRDWPDASMWHPSEDAQIGWGFDGEQFTPPDSETGPPISPYQPLKPYQFWGAVRATGHEAALRAWVAAIEDPVQKGIASAMLDFSLEFRFDHPLMEPARLHLGLSPQEFQDLWLWGLTL